MPYMQYSAVIEDHQRHEASLPMVFVLLPPGRVKDATFRASLHTGQPRISFQHATSFLFASISPRKT